mmetsp:Transcript_167863/g.533815  ORF Transcript_167863/g.533815 Transcript_167863/m.533815 type:complete len:232 (+) Transcript_167863:125-820(+)
MSCLQGCACGAQFLSGRGRARPMVSTHELLDECWLRVLFCFSASELCAHARLSKRFHSLTNEDDLWIALCKLLWAGKQRVKNGELFRNGDYSLVRLSVPECKSLLLRRGVDIAGITEKPELLDVVQASTPPLWVRQPRPPILVKWKTSFACAVEDSRRQEITEEEIAELRWQLVYHGQPSSLGLRNFQKGGVYMSPHLGETRWSLDVNPEEGILTLGAGRLVLPRARCMCR